MKQRELMYGVIGFLAGVVITFFLTTNQSGAMNFGNMMGRNTSLSENASRVDAVDAHFIEQMIPHHEDAIIMSEIALERAQRDEVRELAQAIIKAQSKEIEQMKDWYKNWFGREVKAGDEVMSQHGMMGGSREMHMGMMGDETDIDQLNNAQDFDREFLEEMIPHHQMAVMMASMLKGGTERTEMKELADNIITSQTAEISQMREWLRTWQ